MGDVTRITILTPEGKDDPNVYEVLNMSGNVLELKTSAGAIIKVNQSRLKAIIPNDDSGPKPGTTKSTKKVEKAKKAEETKTNAESVAEVATGGAETAAEPEVTAVAIAEKEESDEVETGTSDDEVQGEAVDAETPTESQAEADEEEAEPKGDEAPITNDSTSRQVIKAQPKTTKETKAPKATASAPKKENTMIRTATRPPHKTSKTAPAPKAAAPKKEKESVPVNFGEFLAAGCEIWTKECNFDHKGVDARAHVIFNLNTKKVNVNGIEINGHHYATLNTYNGSLSRKSEGVQVNQYPARGDALDKKRAALQKPDKAGNTYAKVTKVKKG